MKEKLFFRKLKLFAVIILLFAIIACNRENSAPIMPTAYHQIPSGAKIVCYMPL